MYLFTDAVKLQPLYKNISQNEMETQIKYHLAQSPFTIKRMSKEKNETTINN